MPSVDYGCDDASMEPAFFKREKCSLESRDVTRSPGFNGARFFQAGKAVALIGDCC